MKTFQRSICILLTLVMVLSACPVAFAETAPEEQDIIENDPAPISDENDGNSEEEPETDNLAWSVSDDGTVLTISGAGNMRNYGYGEAPWFSYADTVEEIVIESGVTSIGGFAFDQFERVSGRLVIPEGITSVGACAFRGCALDDYVVFPASLTGYVGNEIFNDCEDIKGFYFLGNPPSAVEGYAFPDNSKIYYKSSNAAAWVQGEDFPFENNTWQFISTDTEPWLAGSGKCGDNLDWELSNSGTLTISGSGAMYDFTSKSPAPWADDVEDITEVEIESGVTTIGDNAFAGCTKINGYITIPASVADIGANAFAAGENLKGFYFLGNPPTWEDTSFPESKTLYYKEAADNTAWEAKKDNSKWTIVGTDVEPWNIPTVIDSGKCGDNLVWEFNDKGLLTISGSGAMNDYGRNDSEIGWLAYRGSIEHIVFENGITRIGDCAFWMCSDLQEMPELPETLESIGYEAFGSCGNMTGELILPDSLTTIEYGAFSYCGGFSKLNIGTGLTTLEGAFRDVPIYDINVGNNTNFKVNDLTIYSVDGKTIWYCSPVKEGSITIPSGVTTIADRAFSGCSKLTGDLIFPDGFTTLGDLAFGDCSGLSGKVVFPDGIETIGQRAFESANNISGFYFEGKEPSSVWEATAVDPQYSNLSLSSFPASKTVYYKEGFNWNVASDGKWKGYTTATVTAGGTIDGTDITWSLDSTGLLTISGSDAMPDFDSTTPAPWSEHAASIKSVTINGIASVGDNAFNSYTNLSGKVTFPESIKAIGANSFKDTGITECVFLGDAPSVHAATADDASFDSDVKIFYPNDAKDWDVDSDGKWNGYTASEAEIGECGDNLLWTYSDGVLTISGSGEMDSYPDEDAPWYDDYRDEITDIVIAEGVTSIGENAFAWWDKNEDGEFITLQLPSTLVSIENFAFRSNERLSGDLILPDSLKQIGEEAFRGCTGLNGKLSIGKNILSLSSGLFAYTNFTEITVNSNKNFKAIDHVLYNSDKTEVLYGDASLTAVPNFPKSVKKIMFAAFAGRSGMKGILKLPENLEEIYPESFADCTGLDGSVIVPENILAIWGNAFIGADNIDGFVFLNEPPTHIFAKGDDAHSLPQNATVYYPYGVDKWSEPTWAGYTSQPYITESEYSGGCTKHCGKHDHGHGKDFDMQTLFWQYKQGVLRIVGDGCMIDFADAKSVPWKQHVKKIHTVIWDDTVYHIGDYSFAEIAAEHSRNSDRSGKTPIYYQDIPGISQEESQTINLSAASAVSECAELDNTIHIPKATFLRSAADAEVMFCSTAQASEGELTLSAGSGMKLPASLESIGASAFAGASFAGDVTIPASVTEIGASAFAGCSNIDDFFFKSAEGTAALGSGAVGAGSTLYYPQAQSSTRSISSAATAVYTLDHHTITGAASGKDAILNAQVYLYSSGLSDTEIAADVTSNRAANCLEKATMEDALKVNGELFDRGYTITDVPAGNYKLAFYKPGYDVKVEEITVGSNSSNSASGSMEDENSSDVVSLTINGDSIAVTAPAAGQSDNSYTFSATGYGSDGKELSNTAVKWSVDYPGVSIDDNGNLTITSAAQAGEFTLTATAGNGVSTITTVTVSKAQATTPSNPSSGSSSGKPSSSKDIFWYNVERNILAAPEDATIRVEIGIRRSVPKYVMDALRRNSDVCLTLLRNGEVIVHIPAGKAPAAEYGQNDFSIEELVKAFSKPAATDKPKNTKPADKPEETVAEPPVTEEEDTTSIFSQTPAETEAESAPAQEEAQETVAEVTVVQNEESNGGILKIVLCMAAVIGLGALVFALRRR